MLRKYSILYGIIISLLLLMVATLYYPGGSLYDKNAVGFDWKNNYLSNLFAEKAVNGADNAARPWAVCGMLFLCISFALFFIEFSKKMSQKGAANIIKYAGVAAMLFAFLAVTPYHDSVLIFACTLAPISMFYITVFVLKSKLHLFKILSVACLAVLYIGMYSYYTRSYLEFLPTIQKAALLIVIIWVLCLQYFTTVADFEPGKKAAV